MKGDEKERHGREDKWIEGKGSGGDSREAVIEGVRMRAKVFVRDIVLNKADDVVVCLPGAKIETITERVENIVSSWKGGSVLAHVVTSNVERDGTTAIVRKYRNLVRTLKKTRIEQVILSGILPLI